MKKFVTLMVVFLALTQSAFAALSSQQKLADFTSLVGIIERHYGPLLWKSQTIGLNFKQVSAQYEQMVRESRSDAEFYRLLARFVAELKDAHVSPIIPSNYRAQLGFGADLVEGRVLIEKVDRLRLPEVLFPFKKGDQLISIGGVPVETLIAELSRTGHT